MLVCQAEAAPARSPDLLFQHSSGGQHSCTDKPPFATISSCTSVWKMCARAYSISCYRQLGGCFILACAGLLPPPHPLLGILPLSAPDTLPGWAVTPGCFLPLVLPCSRSKPLSQEVSLRAQARKLPPPSTGMSREIGVHWGMLFWGAGYVEDAALFVLSRLVCEPPRVTAHRMGSHTGLN